MPSYNDPNGIIAASVILELVAAFCVGCRFLSRRKKGISFATDDWLILTALVGSTGLTVMEIYGCATGVLGVPLNMALEDPMAVSGRVNKAKHIELATIAVGVPTLGLIKLSICFLYRRIFAKPIFRRLLDVWIVIIALWTVAFELAGLLECGSRLKALFGTPQDYLRYCGDAIHAGFAMVGSDVGSDIITLIIPIPMIWSLQMPTHRKLLLVATFMIGLLSVGAGIGKTYIYVQSSLGISKIDGILSITGFSVWNLVEVQVGIIAACGALLRPVLKDLLPTSSLTALLESFRRRVPSSFRRSHVHSQQLPPHSRSGHPDNFTNSDEGLVRTFDGANGGKAEAGPRVADPEMGSPFADPVHLDEIHVKKTMVVERV